MSKIGFIGTGNMGGALARAVSKSGHDIYLSDFLKEKAEALAEELENACATDNAAIVASCDMIFLGVKPQMLPALADELASGLAARQKPVCLVSMAAGVSLERLGELFGKNTPILRIMPNTPVAIGAGMILWCDNGLASEGDKRLLEAALRFAGKLDAIPERLIDAASALSGCGPAFVCLFIEALADGGVRCGLPRDKALLYAIETAKGTAALIAESGKHPGQLKDEVCSPAGSTIEGVTALENGGFRALAIDAVTTAYERTKELGK
ncbi:MAG: pyrroline-5-carboxylate reductase [Ruminococcaceae bacterium]|nr:pyrroline-5-carboxylate reductase [Oscillospiraceae bacterium]